jgi:N-acetylglutamate synthase-like GNAT family acetyltransferase
MSIITRELRQSDIPKIDEIYNRQSNIDVPSLNNMITNAVIENENTGKVLGYGAVKLFTEAILILDKQLSKRDRAQALVESMKNAIVFSRDAGIEHLFAVSNDPSFARVLENRYKFYKISGTLLRLDL